MPSSLMNLVGQLIAQDEQIAASRQIARERIKQLDRQLLFEVSKFEATKKIEREKLDIRREELEVSRQTAILAEDQLFRQTVLDDFNMSKDKIEIGITNNNPTLVEEGLAGMVQGMAPEDAARQSTKMLNEGVIEIDVMGDGNMTRVPIQHLATVQQFQAGQLKDTMARLNMMAKVDKNLAARSGAQMLVRVSPGLRAAKITEEQLQPVLLEFLQKGEMKVQLDGNKTINITAFDITDPRNHEMLAKLSAGTIKKRETQGRLDAVSEWIVKRNSTGAVTGTGLTSSNFIPLSIALGAKPTEISRVAADLLGGNSPATILAGARMMRDLGVPGFVDMSDEELVQLSKSRFVQMDITLPDGSKVNIGTPIKDVVAKLVEHSVVAVQQEGIKANEALLKSMVGEEEAKILSRLGPEVMKIVGDRIDAAARTKMQGLGILASTMRNVTSRDQAMAIGQHIMREFNIKTSPGFLAKLWEISRGFLSSAEDDTEGVKKLDKTPPPATPEEERMTLDKAFPLGGP